MRGRGRSRSSSWSSTRVPGELLVLVRARGCATRPIGDDGFAPRVIPMVLVQMRPSRSSRGGGLEAFCRRSRGPHVRARLGQASLPRRARAACVPVAAAIVGRARAASGLAWTKATCTTPRDQRVRGTRFVAERSPCGGRPGLPFMWPRCSDFRGPDAWSPGECRDVRRAIGLRSSGSEAWCSRRCGARGGAGARTSRVDLVESTLSSRSSWGDARRASGGGRWEVRAATGGCADAAIGRVRRRVGRVRGTRRADHVTVGCRP